MRNAVVMHKTQLRHVSHGQFIAQPAAQESCGTLKALEGRLRVIIGIQEAEKDLGHAQVLRQLYDVKVGDQIECFERVEVARTLD